jgi:hypothetical protein
MLRPKIRRDGNGVHFMWVDRSRGFGATCRYATSGPSILRTFFRWLAKYLALVRHEG